MSAIGDRIALVRGALAKGILSLSQMARLESGNATEYLNGAGGFTTPGGGGLPSGGTPGQVVTKTPSGADWETTYVLLSSAVVTNQDYFDLDLPAGYAEFKCEIARLVFSTTTTGLAAAVSADGGATFYNGDTDYSVTTNFNAGSDQKVLLYGFNQWDSHGSQVSLTIVSGAVNHRPYVSGVSAYQYASGSTAAYEINSSWLKTDVIVNKIRFAPYGAAGDMNPPAGVIKIVSASYYLWGLPIPS